MYFWRCKQVMLMSTTCRGESRVVTQKSKSSPEDFGLCTGLCVLCSAQNHPFTAGEAMQAQDEIKGDGLVSLVTPVGSVGLGDFMKEQGLDDDGVFEVHINTFSHKFVQAGSDVDTFAHKFAEWVPSATRQFKAKSISELFERVRVDEEAVTVIGFKEFPYSQGGDLEGADREIEREYWLQYDDVLARYTTTPAPLHALLFSWHGALQLRTPSGTEPGVVVAA